MRKWSGEIYSGPLANYHYPLDKEVGDLLLFLQQINSKLKIHLTDTLHWKTPFPSDTTADVYVVCGFGEFVNEDILHQIDNKLADRKLILLTSQYYNPCNLKNFTVFNIEHLHTAVRFFTASEYIKLTQRPFVHATQSRRNALHKSLITQYLMLRCPELQYTFCNLPTNEYQIDTFKQDLQTVLAMTCTDQILEDIKKLHAEPRSLPGHDWDITELYKTSKLFWTTESVFLSRKNCPTAYLTEKTLKPVVAGSAWIVAGQQHSYRRIRSLGLETFEPDFGITYDDSEDPDRMSHIYSVIDTVDFQQILNSSDLQQKVDYNYNYFFNHMVVHVEKENQPKIQQFLDYVHGL